MAKPKVAQGPEPIEFYEVRAGSAVALVDLPQESEGFLKATGHVYPSADEVLHMGGRRVVIYPQGVARAWPVAGPAVTQPHAFTQDDLKATHGSYMVYRLREVLTPDEEGGKWPTWSIVTLVAVGVLAVLVGIDMYFSWKGWDILHGLV